MFQVKCAQRTLGALSLRRRHLEADKFSSLVSNVTLGECKYLHFASRVLSLWFSEVFHLRNHLFYGRAKL